MTRRSALLAATVFAVATCLRPAITAVGPVLTRIGEDLGLGESALGLLGALPLLAFAAVSPLVHRLSGRIGVERAILVSLVILAAGILVRSYTGSAGLWIGTIVLGSAIAVGNVLVPVLVRRDYPSNVSRATGVYTACLTLAAGTASAIAVPLSDAVDWRFALAIWAGLALVISLVWLPRVAAAPTARTLPAYRDANPVSVWRQPMAWGLTAFMGLQSTTFYIMVTWLPTIETAAGVEPTVAGVHMFVFQGVGILAGLAIPSLMQHPTDQRAGVVVASAPMVIASAGFVFAPGLMLLWVVIAGLGQGAAFVAALSLVSLRGRNHHETTKLSGMTQSVGYLLAATGPVLTGSLAESTGRWYVSLVVLGALSVLQLAVAAIVGRDRKPDEDSELVGTV